MRRKHEEDDQSRPWGQKYADAYPHVNGFLSAGVDALFLNNPLMASGVKNPIIERIDRAIKARKTSREAVALKAGLSRDFIRKWEQRGPHASIRHASLKRLAAVLDMPYADLIAESAESSQMESVSLRGEARLARTPQLTMDGEKPVPVLGTAAGAITNGFQLTQDIIDLARRPPALIGIDDAYAIYVVSESMEPLHRPGDLCFVHPGRPCLSGDSVIIQTRAYEGAQIEAYIKTYVKTDAEWIIARQYNPFSEIKFARKNVFMMHHVMTMRELFGM